MKARTETSLFKESAIKQGIGKAQLLADVITQSMGMFRTAQVAKGGGMIIYLQDKANLYESAVVWKISSAGFFVSTDGMRTWNAGITPEGDVAVNVLSAVGINFDWARGGTLTLGGKENGHGVLQVLNENDDNVFRVNNEGIVAGETALANIKGVRTTLIFSSYGGGIDEFDVYNPLGMGLVYDTEDYPLFFTGGKCTIMAYIPSTFVVENAIIFGSFIAMRNKWENESTGTRGTVTGYSRHITLKKVPEEILIDMIQSNQDYGDSMSIGYIPNNSGALNGSRNGPNNVGVIEHLQSGNIGDNIDLGAINFFNITADVFSTKTYNDANLRTAASYAGAGIATLYISGYYK